MYDKEHTEFRKIKRQELSRKLFETFRRHQVVGDCVRKAGGQWVVQPDPFVDEWSKEDYGFLIKCLEETLDTGGAVFGAFREGNLKGFASVDGRPLGSRGQYLDLTSLHVSEEMRGLGIGRKLFAMAAAWAKGHGGQKLYISSHSAVETQKFYEAMGCVDALECSEKHVRQEPYDRQLELDLAGYPDTGGKDETDRTVWEEHVL
ncbi:MAG: GNAT family N-acetyltransferase [Hungatella sp.]|nr:GNAT family N-acetyltransferase [Hungatella sp.]